MTNHPHPHPHPHDHDHDHDHDGHGDDHDGPKPVKVKAHHGLCQGWGECHRWAPDIYPLGPDGKIDIERLEVPGELAEAAWRGAAACPEQAITVIGERPASWREFERTPAAAKADRSSSADAAKSTNGNSSPDAER